VPTLTVMGFFFKNPNYIATRIQQLQALWVMIPTCSEYVLQGRHIFIGMWCLL